jgi:hypothetical protein
MNSIVWERYSQNVRSHAHGVRNHSTDEPEQTSAKNIDRAPVSRMNTTFAPNDTFSSPLSIII